MTHAADQSERLPRPGSDAPVRPNWNACGLQAAPPASAPSQVGSAILTYGIQWTLWDFGAMQFCQAVQKPDPPPEDRLALLRVFRL
jgi:hypothetical protein